MTSAAFRRHNTLEIFTDMDWKSRTTHWHEAFSKIEEVSQNFFVLTLSISKVEEVSQNCFDFKLAERQADRQIDNYNCNYNYNYNHTTLRLQIQKQTYYATVH